MKRIPLVYLGALLLVVVSGAQRSAAQQSRLDSLRHVFAGYEQMQDTLSMSHTLAFIAAEHAARGRHDEALQCYHRIKSMAETTGDTEGLALALLRVGGEYLHLKMLDSSVVAGNRAYGMLLGIGDARMQKDCTSMLARCFAAMGDFTTAAKMQYEHNKLADSVTRMDGDMHMREMRSRYEAEARERVIALMVKDTALRALELRQRQDELLRQGLESEQRRRELELRRTQREISKLMLASAGASLEKQRLENTKRENDVGILTRDRALQASLIERETSLRNAAVVGTVMLLCIAGVIYTRWRSRKRMGEQLAGTLEQLTRTQEQLIHAEKMATLGEMTAGIAHEIRNPLNFVNNFAMLSAELAVDLREQLQDGTVKNPEGRAAMREIIGLLHDNAVKVHTHGCRADTIVSNMMRHARRQSGVRQEVDINHLVDEAASLAVSGLRHGDDHASVAVHRNYDPRAGMLLVLPQEISRVVLNVMNNALYASLQQHRAAGPHSEPPAVHLATERRGASVQIRIRDNGPGVPADIRGKIFQPFFTTKPTGEGTGLGLSMSYDIIVHGHGGTLICNSSGPGAEFIITLPEKREQGVQEKDAH